MTTLDASSTVAAGMLHWGRILSGAFVLELLLFVVLIPIGLTFGMPGAPGATDFTVFFIAVPVGCFLAGCAIAAWMLRTVLSRRALHGALLGVVATLIYLAICAAQPGAYPRSSRVTGYCCSGRHRHCGLPGACSVQCLAAGRLPRVVRSKSV